VNQGTLQAPAVRVLANGAPLVAIVDAQWSLPLGYQSGSFSFTKAFPSDDKNPPAWWCATGNKQIKIEIQVALDAAGFVSVFTGLADSHSYDPLTRVIQVQGRDGAAVFIDTRITDTYRNLTSSQVAQKIAAGHGLTAQVTATTTLIGRYYDADNDVTTAGSFSRAVSEWDLLCLLGQKEGFVPYVSGSVLYFQAAPSPPPVFTIWITEAAGGARSSNALTLKLERSLTMARDVTVSVKSWHSGKKASVVGSAVTKSKAPATDSTVPPSNYVFYIPNLTHAQADAAAQRLAQDIAQHERVISFSVPGAVLTPAHVISLAGTGTDYDGIQYFPDSISNSVSVNGGFVTSGSCKNYSPLSLYDGASGVLIK
jgi:hypothetical protein